MNEDNSEHHPVKYNPGDVLWGRVSGHPWWPCMVTNGPGIATYTRLIKRRQNTMVHYNVQFFGDVKERAWVGDPNFLPFEGRAAFERLRQEKLNVTGLTQLNYKKEKQSFIIAPRREKAWSTAVDQAEEAALLVPSLRLERYSEAYPVVIQPELPAAPRKQKRTTALSGEQPPAKRSRNSPSGSPNSRDVESFSENFENDDEEEECLDGSESDASHAAVSLAKAAVRSGRSIKHTAKFADHLIDLMSKKSHTPKKSGSKSRENLNASVNSSISETSPTAMAKENVEAPRTCPADAKPQLAATTKFTAPARSQLAASTKAPAAARSQLASTNKSPAAARLQPVVPSGVSAVEAPTFAAPVTALTVITPTVIAPLITVPRQVVAVDNFVLPEIKTEPLDDPFLGVQQLEQLPVEQPVQQQQQSVQQKQPQLMQKRQKQQPLGVQQQLQPAKQRTLTLKKLLAMQEQQNQIRQQQQQIVAEQQRLSTQQQPEPKRRFLEELLVEESQPPRKRRKQARPAKSPPQLSSYPLETIIVAPLLPEVKIEPVEQEQEKCRSIGINTDIDMEEFDAILSRSLDSSTLGAAEKDNSVIDTCTQNSTILDCGIVSGQLEHERLSENDILKEKESLDTRSGCDFVRTAQLDEAVDALAGGKDGSTAVTIGTLSADTVDALQGEATDALQSKAMDALESEAMDALESEAMNVPQDEGVDALQKEDADAPITKAASALLSNVADALLAESVDSLVSEVPPVEAVDAPLDEAADVSLGKAVDSSLAEVIDSADESPEAADELPEAADESPEAAIESPETAVDAYEEANQPIIETSDKAKTAVVKSSEDLDEKGEAENTSDVYLSQDPEDFLIDINSETTEVAGAMKTADVPSSVTNETTAVCGYESNGDSEKVVSDCGVKDIVFSELNDVASGSESNKMAASGSEAIEMSVSSSSEAAVVRSVIADDEKTSTISELVNEAANTDEPMEVESNLNETVAAINDFQSTAINEMEVEDPLLETGESGGKDDDNSSVPHDRAITIESNSENSSGLSTPLSFVESSDSLDGGVYNLATIFNEETTDKLENIESFQLCGVMYRRVQPAAALVPQGPESTGGLTTSAGFPKLTSESRFCLACDKPVEEEDRSIQCTGPCLGFRHLSCLGPQVLPDVPFKCNQCSADSHSCFICKSASIEMMKCGVADCGKFYHRECLAKFLLKPCANASSTGSSNGSSLTCPHHVCFTCAMETGKVTGISSKGSMYKCRKCPRSYHANQFCLPVSCKVMDGKSISCHAHQEGPKLAFKVSANWCSICSEGSKYTGMPDAVRNQPRQLHRQQNGRPGEGLAACAVCPASFHPSCDKISPLTGSWTCRDCLAGKQICYGDVVWAKFANFRWLPARIVQPSEADGTGGYENIKKYKPGCTVVVVVELFGSRLRLAIPWTRLLRFEDGQNLSKELTHKRLSALYENGLQLAYQGFEKRSKQKKQELCLDAKSSLKPQPYKHVKVNIPLGGVEIIKAAPSENPTCHCTPNEAGYCCGPDSDCINRLMQYECHPQVCLGQDKCLNQRLTRKQDADARPKKTSEKGWGLFCRTPIVKGQFIGEYVGDLVDSNERDRRLHEAQVNGITNFYMLTLDKNRVIDAGPKGNYTRFLNHSCEPNCETQKWTVSGDIRIGLFALRDVAAGSELTFNYNLDCYGNEKTKCKCGSVICSGFLGVRPKTAAAAETEKKSLESKLKKDQQQSNQLKKRGRKPKQVPLENTLN